MATTPDLTEFFKLSKPKRKPCVIGFVLTQLDDAEATQLNAALDTDKGIITASAIRQWLAARKHDASISGIANHRNGGCTCNGD